MVSSSKINCVAGTFPLFGIGLYQGGIYTARVRKQRIAAPLFFWETNIISWQPEKIISFFSRFFSFKEASKGPRNKFQVELFQQRSWEEEEDGKLN